MKVTYYAMSFMICVTAMVMIVQAMGFNPQPMTPYDPDNIENALDTDAITGTIDPNQSDFWNWGIIIGTWKKTLPIVEAPIAFFEKLGMPGVLVAAILVPWRFVWFGFLVSFISGRDFMP